MTSVAREAGATPLTPERRNRNGAIHFSLRRYVGRHLIENAFSRLKVFRRIKTRFDKLAANFFSAMTLATAVGISVKMSICPSCFSPKTLRGL